MPGKAIWWAAIIAWTKALPTQQGLHFRTRPHRYQLPESSRPTFMLGLCAMCYRPYASVQAILIEQGGGKDQEDER